MELEYKNRLDAWIKNATEDEEIQSELLSLIQNGALQGVRARFTGGLPLGPEGFVAIMGAGTSRMNLYTVRRLAQGYALWLKEQTGQRPVAIGFDSRYKSELFATEAARVLAANGIFVWLFRRMAPAAALSYTLRSLGCGGGLYFTAGTLPDAYNGCRLYGADGGVLEMAAAASVQKRTSFVDEFADVRLVKLEPSIDVGMVRMVREECFDAYLDSVRAQSLQTPGPHQPLRLVYSPLNGAGMESVTRVLETLGMRDVVLVQQQVTTPDPANDEALAKAQEMAWQLEADLVLATGPACERIGVMVRTGDGVQRLTSDEVGVLLVDYLCRRRLVMRQLPNSPLIVKTALATGMVGRVAARYGAESVQVPGNAGDMAYQLRLLDSRNMASRFVFAMDEHGGFLTQSSVRQWDGTAAAMLVCEMARDYRSRGITLRQAMDQLCREYGYMHSSAQTVLLKTKEEKRREMRQLRDAPLATVAGLEVEAHQDYLHPAPSRSGLAATSADLLEYRLRGGARVLLAPAQDNRAIHLHVEAVAPSAESAAQNAEELMAGMASYLRAGSAQSADPNTTASAYPGYTGAQPRGYGAPH